MAITAGFVWRCIYVDGDGKGPPPPVLDGNDDPNHLEQVMLAPYKTKKGALVLALFVLLLPTVPRRPVPCRSHRELLTSRPHSLDLVHRLWAMLPAPWAGRRGGGGGQQHWPGTARSGQADPVSGEEVGSSLSS